MQNGIQFLKSPAGKLLLVAILWQLTYTLLGYFLSPHQGILGHLQHWDGNWYAHIIANHYGFNDSPAAPAFYPLFPFVVSLLSFGFIDIHIIGLTVNTIALWMALLALYKILSTFKLKTPAKIATLAVFLCFPSAFFMHVFYGEALFIALAFWSYYFSLTRRWWAVGILLAFLTASRLPSLLFIALCGLEYLRSYNWNIRKALNTNALWFLLAPLGFLVYGLYLLIVRRDFLAMFHAYSATNDWTYQHFSLNIFSTIGKAALEGVTGIGGLGAYTHFVTDLLPILALIAVLTASIYIFVKLRSNAIPLFAFGILSIIFYTLNDNVVSVHRYALPVIVMYIVVALFYKKGFRTYLIYSACVAMLGVQLFLFAKFVNDIFAG